MIRRISESATDPLQYDGTEIIWGDEGHGLSPIRRVFLERLSPFLGNIAGKTALDLGCGQGWLCNELARRGAAVVGVDPSLKNVQSAREQYPDIQFIRSDLHALPDTQNYDLVTAIMVFEHFPSLEDGFGKIKRLMSQHGNLLLITGDFKKFTNPRHGYTVDTEVLGPGEVATRTDYGQRAGVIYDINRETERFVEVGGRTGFSLSAHEPIAAPDWLLDEQPRYTVHKDEPLFHLMEFSLKD